MNTPRGFLLPILNRKPHAIKDNVHNNMYNVLSMQYERASNKAFNNVPS